MKMRQRKASHKHKVVQTSGCPNCNGPKLPHRVCPSCGYYGDRQVLTIKSDD
jgi:large subunit ribosomal protein L32